MTDEEEVTAQLLRLAGEQADPPAERTARVRHAVQREWLANRRHRAIRRGAAAATALLGVAAVLTIAVWINRPRSTPSPPVDRAVAIGQRIQGRPVVLGRGTPRPLAASIAIYPEDVIETDDESRATLQAADGSSVRIDRGSRVKFVAPGVIEVLAGAAYLATADGSHGFEVRTAMGVVRDIGTQFEVRLTAAALRLRVRTGTVEVRRGDSVTAAGSGTEAIVTSSGVAVRQMPAYGSEWAWTADVAPSFAIEGRSLGAFLEHIAGEQGWTLQYADPEVAEAAERIILHGSVEGLAAEEALDVALATSGQQYRLRGGELLVSRPVDAR